METIGKQKIWSFLDRSGDCQVTTNTRIREGAGHKVGSFLELAQKIAELQFLNRDHVLLFCGQGGDDRNIKGNTSVKPTLFRPEGRGNPGPATLERRFEILARAERSLVGRYQSAGFRGLDRIKRHHVLRWSILQHYKVCATPLLDVTHSIRIAASFASLSTRESSKVRAYLFVLGVPNLSGAVTASAEAGLQIVRLSSVCPPQAVRPHIQEGYLLGQYPEITGVAERENYFHHEMDFGLRPVAKFHFEPASFWTDNDFPQVTESALFPNANDPLYRLALDVQREVGK
jgi:FRG domain